MSPEWNLNELNAGATGLGAPKWLQCTNSFHFFMVFSSLFFCILILLVMQVGFVVLNPANSYCLSTDEKMWKATRKKMGIVGNKTFSRWGQKSDHAQEGFSAFAWHKILSIIIYGVFLPSKWTPVKFPHPNQTFSLFPWSRNDKPSCPQVNHSFSFLSLCRRWNSRCTWRVWWRKAMVAIFWFSVGSCIYITVLAMSFLYFSSFLQLPVSDGELRAPRKCKKQEWTPSGNVGWGGWRKSPSTSHQNWSHHSALLGAPGGEKRHWCRYDL